MLWKPEESSISEFFNWYYSFREYDSETYLYYKDHLNEIGSIYNGSIYNDSVFDRFLNKYNLSRSEIPTLFKIKNKLQINTEEEMEFINHVNFCISSYNNPHYTWY